MDKSWMKYPRVSKEFLQGLNQFLDFAFSRASRDDKILCPCKSCSNRFWMSRNDVYDHLVCIGFIKDYTNWMAHGEASSSNAPIDDSEVQDEQDLHGDINDLLYDTFGVQRHDEAINDEPQVLREGPNVEAEKFFKLIEEGQQDLYLGCKKFSKLSFIIQLFLMKCLGGWTNKSFTMLLELLKEVLPEGETLPKSFYETKKIIKELGLGYEKIHACRNDCMLFWKEHANDSECHVCGASRWKTSLDDSIYFSKPKAPKIPVKVLRYFPLKPRLQRLFMSSKTASFMRWHEESRVKDGHLRHPADSPAWKTFDYLHKDFSADPRNVRLGLAADGFNPFRTMSVSHSTWPVVLMSYNLPPWMCMKQPYMMLSLLIPGPLAPGNDIDIYLQPLIDELKELWEIGVNTYDASKKENFRMHAALMWTINDFPGYANLSGWSTKGQFACPSCHKHTRSKWLRNGRKYCYMGHRRFLDRNHVFRRQKRSFDNNQELGVRPNPLGGSEVLNELNGFDITFGKMSINPSLPYSWKKRSIFFSLPYWKDNLLRHNLDVMHIEKNVCDNIIGTLLNLEGKTKDNLKARLDLQEMGIRHELHPSQHQVNKTYLPPACFSMAVQEKQTFCKVLKGVKVPDGYASNISRCVNLKQRKILSLKSHDSHILMHQILPLALRRVLPKQINSPLIELCSFFRELCSKVVRVQDFIRLESRVALTLCHLERIFPPTFFDIMVHLPIHLAAEARIAGPIQYRWMYPIERYLLTLKSYVRNKSRPEGSIAEGYLAEECLTFCSRYLKGVETRFNRPTRNDEEVGIDEDGSMIPESSIFFRRGRPLGKGELFSLDYATMQKAHQYVLNNCDKVKPFIEQHLALTKGQNSRASARVIHRIHNETFPSWFADQVQQLSLARNGQLDEDLRCLARPPNPVARRYKGFIINGFRFHTKELEKKRKTQNSGVVVTAKTLSFASSRDKSPIDGDVTYYGVLTKIIELDYWIGRKIVLFSCDWVSNSRGIQHDELGFTLVNFSRLMRDEEPFVFASQANQAFYVQDPIDNDWHVVIKTTPKDLYDMNAEVSVDDVETYLQNELCSGRLLDNVLADCIDNVSWIRKDIDGVIVNSPILEAQPAENNQGNNFEHDDEDIDGERQIIFDY